MVSVCKVIPYHVHSVNKAKSVLLYRPTFAASRRKRSTARDLALGAALAAQKHQTTTQAEAFIALKYQVSRGAVKARCLDELQHRLYEEVIVKMPCASVVRSRCAGSWHSRRAAVSRASSGSVYVSTVGEVRARLVPSSKTTGSTSTKRTDRAFGAADVAAATVAVPACLAEPPRLLPARVASFTARLRAHDAFCFSPVVSVFGGPAPFICGLQRARA